MFDRVIEFKRKMLSYAVVLAVLIASLSAQVGATLSTVVGEDGTVYFSVVAHCTVRFINAQRACARELL